MPITVSLRDDLVQVGLTEDGEADLKRYIYLVARDDRGAQAAHDFGLLVGRSEENTAIARLERLARKVRHHLAAGGRLDPAHWLPVDPAYGSEAYQDLDQFGYFAGAEVLRDIDHGERVDQQRESEARFWVESAGDLPFPA